MSGIFTGFVVEHTALAWLNAWGYPMLHGRDSVAGEPVAGCSAAIYRDVVPEKRRWQALVRPNPDLPREGLENPWHKSTRVDWPSLVVSDGFQARRAG